MKKRILFSIISLGVTAMAAQIVLIREFLIVFSGDELSIGIILAAWLISTAIGSLVLGRFADKIRSKDFFLRLCQIFLSVLLLAEIFMIRAIRPVLHINTGEIIPFYVLAGGSFLILFPLSAVLGFLFSLISSFNSAGTAPPASRIGNLYALESFGSMLGGIVVSLILIRLLNSFQILSILSFLNALLALSFVFAPSCPPGVTEGLTGFTLGRQRKPAAIAALVVVIFLILSWPAGIWQKSDLGTLKRQWQDYEILSVRNSIYGNIAALKREGQFSIFNNGHRLYTVPDKLSSEEAVHFCLLEHANPKDVLLIGGGAGGLCDEILKYDLKSVDYVELDPAIIKTAEDIFPEEYTESLKNKKVKIHNTDGRYFVKTTDKKYDCIIIHLGDPYTAQLNRFYTREFFAETGRVLKRGGVVSFYLTASESYLGIDNANFLRCVYSTLRDSFPEVITIPGETAYFLASNIKGTLTYDYNLLMRRAKGRILDLKYVREYYLFSRMNAEKISYFENVLKGGKNISINYDFRPAAYYYGIISWSSRFRDSVFTKMLKSVNEKRIWMVMALFCLSAVLLRNVPLFSAACAGFSQMSFQMIFLFSFQVIYGYLFYKLGLLLTFFMLGLALSSCWVSSEMQKIKSALSLLAIVQIGVCAFALTLPASLKGFSSTKDHFVSLFGEIMYFPLASFLSGFLGGLIFPLANKIYFTEKKEGEGLTAGLIYGVDLLGACFGAVLSAVFLIPILGVFKTCLFIAVLNFTCLIMTKPALKNLDKTNY